MKLTELEAFYFIAAIFCFFHVGYYARNRENVKALLFVVGSAVFNYLFLTSLGVV